ncbi:hypothetical protein BsIDN1_40010 [Bacillus safensis]|uniref:Uncharacterized protein n=1 Tax=Bacillus safensis TaxID=561879 RepID=A0A5S9MB96_BACIA|nr:hypothetical protein BsIDN1_40010 [Bacillus safensis]
MVIRSFMLGVILVFPTMFIQYVLQEENIATNPILISFVTSGFLEESLKWFILMVSVYAHAQFDEHYIRNCVWNECLTWFLQHLKISFT